MDSATSDWLGPRLEQEIKNAIAWKQRENDPTSLSQSATSPSSPYSYDGSNLWVNVAYAIEEPVLIQVQQFTKTKHPFNCLVSDGFTAVRAKFSKAAAKTLESHSKIDNLAKLSNQVMLNIPRFQVIVAPSGQEADRVQLLIDYVGVVNERRVASLGNPQNFHARPRISNLLHQAERLMHPASETETPAPESVPIPRTRVVKNGQYTQEFATQIQPSLHGAGFEMLGGANLAPPVVPHRNDGSKLFGTRSPRQNHSNPYDGLMTLFPKQNTTTRTVAYDRLPAVNQADKNEIVDLVSASASRSPSPVAAHLNGTMEDTNKTQPARNRSAVSSKSRSWADIRIRVPKRFEYLCPDNQQALLTRVESEYRPRPGAIFPSANVPIELLTELHNKTTSNELLAKDDVDVDLEDDSLNDEVDGDHDAISGAKDHDDSDDDEIIADWPPTPQKEVTHRDDDLPPESSPLRSSPPEVRPKAPIMARNAMCNASQSSSSRRNGPVFEPLMTPVDGDQPMEIDQPPKTVDTAKLFSSAVRPETGTHIALQEPKASNNSLLTLSSDNFRDHSSWPIIEKSQVWTPDREAQSPIQAQSSSSGTQRTSKSIDQSQDIPVGNDVLSLTMRPPPNGPISAVDGADSDLPSEVTGAMAEQQLLHDWKESVQHISDEIQAPATPARIPAEHSSQQDSPTDGSVIHKRKKAPSMSPEEPRNQKVSRFNFTQESPVSQNPALEAAKARQDFLKGRKVSKQHELPPANIVSSPPRAESAPEPAKAENNIASGREIETEHEVEDTSLYGEFRRAYPDYTASIKHFEKMCRNLAASCRRGQVLCHPILWDDYIARSVTDYSVYCHEQVFAAEPQDPYDKYYNEQIEGSLHDKKVVTRAKLVEWFGPEALTPPSRPNTRRSKPRANFDRAGSAQRHSEGGTSRETARPGSVVIKQENQLGKTNNGCDMAGKTDMIRQPGGPQTRVEAILTGRESPFREFAIRYQHLKTVRKEREDSAPVGRLDILNWTL
ncbi:hypothetical protein FKW77_002827 [Venturia effusa]|uniref:Telomere replication protein EST3 n=1 Tax=Venturia effusa TaxID=50376 RepID=A0A517KZ91_9PEZI|nr:hypothetical protein FKW77_002827 [Venturia effusa]